MPEMFRFPYREREPHRLTRLRGEIRRHWPVTIRAMSQRKLNEGLHPELPARLADAHVARMAWQLALATHSLTLGVWPIRPSFPWPYAVKTCSSTCAHRVACIHLAENQPVSYRDTRVHGGRPSQAGDTCCRYKSSAS